MSRSFQLRVVAWMVLTLALAFLLQVFVDAPLWAAASMTGLAVAVVVFLVKEAGPGHVPEYERESKDAADADID